MIPASRWPSWRCCRRPSVSLLVAGWNDTEAPFPDGVRVDELVSAQAARTPDVVAVVAGDESVTYGELEDRANRLAHHLGRGRGGPG